MSWIKFIIKGKLIKDESCYFKTVATIVLINDDFLTFRLIICSL